MESIRLIKSPIKWMGGKAGLAKRIVAQLPLCDVFVEPFGGAASVMFARTPRHHELEVYNDVHEGVVNLFRVLRERGPELVAKLELTPYSRKEHDLSLAWEQEQDILEKARLFYIQVCQGYNGILTSDRSRWSRDKAAMKNVRAWNNNIARLGEVIDRLRRIQIEHDDWRMVLSRYDDVDTVFYLDPPYVPNTLSMRKQPLYPDLLTPEDHGDLIKAMLESVSMIALSGYICDEYILLEKAGWKRLDWNVLLFAVPRRGFRYPREQRVESLWLNPLLQRSKKLDASPRYSGC